MRGGLGVASKITSSSSKLCKKSLSSKTKKNETGINSPNVKYRSRNSKNYDSKCPLCNKIFKDFLTNVDHSCKPFKCNFCDETFSYDFQLKVHKCAEKEVRIKEPNSENNSFQTFDVTFETSNQQQKELRSKKYSRKFDMCRKIMSGKNRDVSCENSKQTSIKNTKHSRRFSKFNKNQSQSTSNNFASPSHLGVELSSSASATISSHEFSSCSQLTDASEAATDDQVPETNSAENGNKTFPIEMEGNQLENTRKMFKRGNSNNNILISSLLKETVDKNKIVNAKSFCVTNSNKKVTFSLNDNANTSSEGGNLMQPPSLNVRNKRKRSAATSKTLTSATAKVTNAIGENNDVVKKRTPDLLTGKQTDGCYESSKCSEPFSSESIVRELEVTESTLNSVPDEFDDFNEKESKSCVSTQYIERGPDDFECLKVVLKDKSKSVGALLRAQQGSYKNYFCPKCRKSFKNIESGVKHYSRNSCKSFIDGQIFYEDILFICLKCLFNTLEYSKLTHHKESCSSGRNRTISYCIKNYSNAQKFVCDKCTYSCVSPYTLIQHDCEKVLKREIKNCSVQLTRIDRKACEDFIKLECSKCDTVFYDQFSYDKHYKEVHEGKSVKSLTKAKREMIQKEKRKMIKKSNTKVYQSPQEIIEGFVEPFSKIELTADPQNTDFLNRDLIDATIPYQNQVLLKEAAKPIVELELKSMCKEFGISSVEEETHSESHLHPPDASPPLRNFKCQCGHITKHLPEKDIKPCIKCLNKFMKTQIHRSSDSNEIQTSTHNSFASVTSDHLNQQGMPEIPSSSFSKLENCTSGGFGITEVSLTAVNVEQSEMELNVVPSLNPSTDIAMPDNIVNQDNFLHNKEIENSFTSVSNVTEADAGDLALMCVDVCYAGTSDVSNITEQDAENSAEMCADVCYAETSDKGNVPNITEQDAGDSAEMCVDECYAGTSDKGNVPNITQQDAGNSAEMCVDECYAGTSDKGIRQNILSSICISSVRSQLVENVQSNDVGTVASCSNNCVSDNLSNSKESVKDHNGTNIKKNLSSMNENISQNVSSVAKVQAQSPPPCFVSEPVKSPDSNVPNVQRTTDSPDSGIDVPTAREFVNYCDFLRYQMHNHPEFDTQFDVANVKVRAHTYFNKTMDNSAYCMRVTEQYYCATCLDEIPVIDLLQHLVEQHNDLDVRICII